MANTTNFGWETPDDTDLVKDGAAAMRTLGNSIDASFVDLKGGTTGQMLTKASNTDLDYTWTTPQVGDITAVTAGTGISGGGTSGDVTITNTMATAIDAKGDLVAGTGADAFARLAVGTNGQYLQADSTTATGLKWASVSTTKSFSLIASSALTSGSTVTLSGISGYDQLFIFIDGASSTTANSDMLIRINSDTGTNYNQWGLWIEADATYDSTFNTGAGYTSQTYFRIGRMSNSALATIQGGIMLHGCNTSGLKMAQITSCGSSASSTFLQLGYIQQGYWNSSSTVSSISIVTNLGTFDAGNLYVYGSA